MQQRALSHLSHSGRPADSNGRGDGTQGQQQMLDIRLHSVEGLHTADGRVVAVVSDSWEAISYPGAHCHVGSSPFQKGHGESATVSSTKLLPLRYTMLYILDKCLVLSMAVPEMRTCPLLLVKSYRSVSLWARKSSHPATCVSFYCASGPLSVGLYASEHVGGCNATMHRADLPSTMQPCQTVTCLLLGRPNTWQSARSCSAGEDQTGEPLCSV